MSTRVRTFLKLPKYSFYPDWCAKGLSLFPTGEWFQNNVVLVTGFTGFVWTKLRPIRAKKERFDCFIELIQTRVAFDCKRALGWKTVMLENFLEINRYFALTPHCNTIGQSNNAFSILGFSRGKTKRPCFDLFIHWQIKQITKTYQSHFSRANENRSMQKWSLPYIFVLIPFLSVWIIQIETFCLKTIHYSFCYSARLRAVPLQSVESKLGRTGESKMAERETPDFPRLLVFYFCSLCSISSLSWPSWGTARSLLFCWTR